MHKEYTVTVAWVMRHKHGTTRTKYLRVVSVRHDERDCVCIEHWDGDKVFINLRETRAVGIEENTNE